MAALLLAGLPMAWQRAVDNGPDLAGFCDAGRYILQHGTRDPESTLSRYWPSADVPWIVLSRLPISVTAVLWYCLNCAAWLGLLHTICHRLLEQGARGMEQGAKHSDSLLPAPSSLPFTDCRHATLAAGLLAMPLVLDGMALGSFHIAMLWLMLLGLDLAFHEKPTSGGILLGTAAWLKLLPLLGVAFLLYHRKWKAAAVAVATVVLLDVSLSLVAFGPAGAWREHVVWWQQGAEGTTDRQLTSQQPCDEDRLTNQSVAITLRRLLTSLGTNASGTYALVRRHVQIAEISPTQLHAVFLAVMGLLALGVAIYCRPARSFNPEPTATAADGLDPRRRWLRVKRPFPQKLIMLSLATLWFSPVAWSYHFVAATPAVAALLLAARYRWTWIALILVVWFGGLSLLAFDTMRAAGVLLWMSLLLGAGLLVYPAYSSRSA